MYVEGERKRNKTTATERADWINCLREWNRVCLEEKTLVSVSLFMVVCGNEGGRGVWGVAKEDPSFGLQWRKQSRKLYTRHIR